MNKLLIKAIKLYQKTLSPDHGLLKIFYPYGYCRFFPSCSEYCKKALIKHRFFTAVYKCLNRLLRCHPWSRGGYDDI